MSSNDDALRLLKYQYTIENSPNGIIYTDRNLVVHHFNAAAEALTGVTYSEVFGKPFNELVPQAGLTLDNIDEARIYRCVISENDIGCRIFSLPNLEPPEQGNGDADNEGYVILLNRFYHEPDLATELERTRSILEDFQALIENSFDGFLVTDNECSVLLFNHAYVRNTGIAPEFLVGKNLRDLINPVWMKTSVAVLAMEERQSVSLHHTTQNNKNIIVTGTPVFDNQNQIKWIIINTRDMSEIYALRDELVRAKEREREYFERLSEENNTTAGENQSIVVVNEKMQSIYGLAKRLGNFDTTVLITGESGVGKELVASYIHENSLRNKEKFVAINCGAIPENLLESELFGYVEGTFTGAVKGGKAGLFEAMDKGTLFLDEIGEMSLNLQVKLLRVLENRMVSRIGSTDQIPVNIRVIAATNKNLNQMVEEGKFREDFYYRLNVVRIEIPPLRERIEDIAPLVVKFLNRFNHRYEQNKKLTFEVLKEMESYHWPGNIRELKNVVENMIVISNNEYLQLSDLPWVKSDHSMEKREGEFPSLEAAIEQTERELLKKAKEKYKSTRKIAEVLNVDQSTVARKLKRYQL